MGAASNTGREAVTASMAALCEVGVGKVCEGNVYQWLQRSKGPFWRSLVTHYYCSSNELPGTGKWPKGGWVPKSQATLSQ